MYTFLRMGVNDFKNRMKMYEKYIFFIRIRFLRYGRNDITYVKLTIVGDMKL